MAKEIKKTGVSFAYGIGALHAMQTLTVPVELKGPARLLLIVLASHADNKTGTCFPSQATLAEECGMSQRAIQYNLNILRDYGQIEIQNRTVENARGKRVKLTNLYRIKNLPKFVGEKPAHDKEKDLQLILNMDV